MLIYRTPCPGLHWGTDLVVLLSAATDRPVTVDGRRPNVRTRLVVELRWGSRGPRPPERPGGPRETSVFRGFKGPAKGPLKLQDDHSLFIDALLQFASVFVLKL